jgi:hypothetical protein
MNAIAICQDAREFRGYIRREGDATDLVRSRSDCDSSTNSGAHAAANLSKQGRRKNNKHAN